MEQKNFIFAFLFILLIFGIVFFWLPQYRQFNDLRLQMREKKLELENKERYFTRLKQIHSSLKKYTLELSKIDSAVPPNPGILDLLYFLGEVSAGKGLIFEKVNFKKISPLSLSSGENKIGERVNVGGSNIKMVSLGISLAGSYSAFKDFISTIEENARLVEVEEVSFFSEKGEIFTINLTIKTHSY